MRTHVAVLSIALSCLMPSIAQAVPRVGQSAPPFMLPTVDGKVVGLAAFKGKPLYLNFYATWCPPCNEEAPMIGKLSQRYKSRGLTVLGVNELESPAKAKEFLEKFHLPYTAVVDSDGKAGKDYGALGLPVHVFINRAGVVSTYRVGEMTHDEIESAIKAIL